MKFDLKIKQSIYYFGWVKIVKRLLKNPTQNYKKHLNLMLSNEKKFFSFKSSFNLGLEFNCMVGLTSLEVYNSVFNTTEEKKQIWILYR